MKIRLTDTNGEIEVVGRMAEMVYRLLEIQAEVDTIGWGVVSLYLRGTRVQPELTRHVRTNTQQHDE
jgi:hypothetical protein